MELCPSHRDTVSVPVALPFQNTKEAIVTNHLASTGDT